MSLGIKIKKHREQANFTKEDLANQMSVTVEDIDLWENEQVEPSIDKLKELAKIFNVTLDDLCNSEEDNSGALFEATMEYNYDILVKAYNVYLKRYYIPNYILFFSSMLIIIGVFSTEINEGFAILPVFLAIFSIANTIKLRKMVKNESLRFLKDDPNLIINYYFFEDYLVFIGKSNNGNRKTIVKYSEFKIKKQDEKYIYLLYDNKFLVIDKDTCKEKHNEIFNLLYINKNCDSRRKTSNLLKLFFILSIVSVPSGLMIISMLCYFSPISEFPFVMVENIWILYLMALIPVTSLILGCVFSKKGYRIKRNIILGIIMTIILLIFGSFHFIIASKFSHDESYLDEISEKINIDLTQIEDISIAYDCIGIYDSFAMAKIEEDKVEGFIKTLENNRNCKNEPFSELDSFDMFASFITFDYDYFLIYDISTNTYNNFSGKLIYVAYNIETNIILICCY